MASFDYISFLNDYFIFIGFFLIGVLFFAGVYYLEKKRRDALKRFAQSFGFSYEKDPEDSAVIPLNSLPVLMKGHSTNAYNLMKGRYNSAKWMVFDYKYTIGYGKHSHTYNQTIALTSGLACPKFTMGSEGFFHKIGEMFGFNDIDFKEHPVFSKMYLLRGEDEAEVRKIFSSDVISLFERNIIKNLSVETDGNNIIFYRVSYRMKPEEIRKFLDDISPIFALLMKKRASGSALEKDDSENTDSEETSDAPKDIQSPVFL